MVTRVGLSVKLCVDVRVVGLNVTHEGGVSTRE